MGRGEEKGWATTRENSLRPCMRALAIPHIIEGRMYLVQHLTQWEAEKPRPGRAPTGEKPCMPGSSALGPAPTQESPVQLCISLQLAWQEAPLPTLDCASQAQPLATRSCLPAHHRPTEHRLMWLSLSLGSTHAPQLTLPNILKGAQMLDHCPFLGTCN